MLIQRIDGIRVALSVAEPTEISIACTDEHSLVPATFMIDKTVMITFKKQCTLTTEDYSITSYYPAHLNWTVDSGLVFGAINHEVKFYPP